ncbi:hypothetical protein KO507_04340 [Gilvimarinus agarilyticus]|uniref:hypothetical protein n=1 Tax=Gilvimarinus sp. 2_MG-2023 TaxID=3062666 RepID=UPI001C08CFC8|nr:hypothetical protein [Gilvimarinus sp. 2_MG-2023]MBU2884994.1 hypothetical protein [Gilvimarinus agarilyticus]MDO6569891.1 hypothetical protein [Gilvimarinus sp. 2_MG-2023]
MFKRISFWLVVVSLCSGCAVGVKHEYEVDPKRVWIRSDATVNVATLDHRPYVISGDKPESFVGLSRGGFGNPFDVVTKSRDPLADDISDTLVKALYQEGMSARKVPLRPSSSVEEAVEALQQEDADRYLLLLLSEWKGDSMMNVAFIYDFEIQVLDEKGTILVVEQYKDKENLGATDAFNPGGGIKIKNRFRSLVPELFSSKEIRAALMEKGVD